MKNVIVIYDDRRKPNRRIRSITGDKSYGETIVKRRTLFDVMSNRIPGLLKYCGDVLYDGNMELKDSVICHMFSNYAICSQEEWEILYNKLPFVRQNYIVLCNQQPAFAVFHDVDSYLDILEAGKDPEALADSMRSFEVLPSEAFVDLSVPEEFMKYITSGFDARFFNALEGDEYTVTKSSTNKEKLKAEYQFYYLLPEAMKMWFVMPFQYEENAEKASYRMERYHMTDLAIRYVHGAISIPEFEGILKDLFRFLSTRKEKKISMEEYTATMERLYIQKVEKRVEELTHMSGYEQLNQLIETGTGYPNLPAIVEEYKSLYLSMTARKKWIPRAVISHGDLCFSNILYQKDAQILRLIDPKGCQTEEGLYTDPYYDLAKLSHSICGGYDFLNSGLYEICLNTDMRFALSIDSDRMEYQKTFRRYLEAQDYDFAMVRLLEASLFLSMLPLHMDRVQKVFGFILNAIHIMEELK